MARYLDASKLILICVMGSAIAACGARPATEPPAPASRASGIEILGVQLVAGGDLAKLSYRVVDYPKAKVALTGDVRLFAEEGGRSLEVLSLGRLGPMRQRPSPTGALQFILFTNRARVLRRGETAIVAIGPERIAGVPIT